MSYTHTIIPTHYQTDLQHINNA